MDPDRPRRLIVNADDFGRTAEINEAVVRAHREGVLTSASLMVNEPAAAAAVEMARRHPGLGVGLHLVLVQGQAALPPKVGAGLVEPTGQFPDDPVLTGMRLFFRRGLRESLRREISAQFDAFAATGLPLDHVNGHLNLHLHPTVLPEAVAQAATHAAGGFRLTRDLLRLDFRLSEGLWAYRLSHAVIFTLLSAYARPRLNRTSLRHTHRVFGLLRNGRVDEAYLMRLLPRLPAGDSELYAHPSLTDFRDEFEALISPRVKALVAREAIRLVRYRDL